MSDDLINWLLMGTQVPDFDLRLRAYDEIMSERGLVRVKDAEITRLREQLADMGRENNLLKYGPPHIGMSLERIMSDDLREQLAEAERQRDAARAEALEEAAQCCSTEADRCDDAVKWGGSRRYISDCKAAAYAMRDRASAIRALIKEGRT